LTFFPAIATMSPLSANNTRRENVKMIEEMNKIIAMGKDKFKQTTRKIKTGKGQQKERPKWNPQDVKRTGNTRIRRISRHR
jgi:hypothetical protein